MRFESREALCFPAMCCRCGKEPPDTDVRIRSFRDLSTLGYLKTKEVTMTVPACFPCSERFAFTTTLFRVIFVCVIGIASLIVLMKEPSGLLRRPMQSLLLVCAVAFVVWLTTFEMLRKFVNWMTGCNVLAIVEVGDGWRWPGYQFKNRSFDSRFQELNKLQASRGRAIVPPGCRSPGGHMSSFNRKTTCMMR